MRGEEADRVVAPVVRQSALGQLVLRHRLVHRHELDRGDAEPGEMVDDRGRGQARVGAAQLGRDLRMAHGEAADVRLVDHGLVIGRARLPVAGPVEVGVDHHAARHERRAVGVVGLGRVARLVVEQRLIPAQAAVDGLAVGVQQQLGRIAAVALLRIVGAGHAVGVALAGADGRQIAVPDEAVDLGEVQPRLGLLAGPAASNKHSWTRSATSENRAKLVPEPSQVAPSGYAAPGQICIR